MCVGAGFGYQPQAFLSGKTLALNEKTPGGRHHHCPGGGHLEEPGEKDQPVEGYGFVCFSFHSSHV